MSPTGNADHGENGFPPWPGPRQHDMTTSGNVHATRRGAVNVNATQRTRGLRAVPKVILAALLADVLYLGYALLVYTGRFTAGDIWRAGILIGMVLATGTLIGWRVRRRA